MELSFEQLKSMVVFAQVVEQGSFSAAAKQLGMTRAVVSYHVKRLEQQLNMKLLNRSTRTHAVTEAGKVYYDSCRIIAEQALLAQQRIENFKNEPEGALKITCPVNLGLQVIVPALSQFRRLYPKITIDIQLTDEIVNILQEGIDLAIRGAPLPDSGLQARYLSRQSTFLCGSPRYFQQQGKPTLPTDLDKHEWIIYSPGANKLELSKGSRSYSVNVEGPLSTNNAAARTVLVEAGHGLGRIPEYDALPRLKTGTLEQVLADYELPPIDIYGVFPPGTASSKKLRILLDYLAEYFERLDV